MRKATGVDLKLQDLLDEVERQHDELNTLLYGQNDLSQLLPQVAAAFRTNITIRTRVRELISTYDKEKKKEA